jgi:superfamily II DNA or RNA helicase
MTDIMQTVRPYQLEALAALKKHNKGIVAIPTGGGKSLIFLQAVKERLQESTKPLNIVVIAPKILLATQISNQFKAYLKSIKNIFITNVHSGEDGITDSKVIGTTSKLITELNQHHLMFTTYKSLIKINESGIPLDIAIFDEAHHSTTESNFIGVAQTSATAENTFFFTATPKNNDTKRSMANSDVYGGVIASVSAKELVENDYILPPKVITYEIEVTRTPENSHHVDSETILNFVDEVDIEYPKILVSVPSTQIMMDMFSDTDMLESLNERGYRTFAITSKYGALVDGVKVSREEFFKILHETGLDPESKFITFHISILAEGIDIPSLNCALILRNLPYIELIQTIGRVLRKHHTKKFGMIAIPVSGSYGKIAARKLQEVVNCIFVEGKIFIV